MSETLILGARNRVRFIILCPPGGLSDRFASKGIAFLNLSGLGRMNRSFSRRPLWLDFLIFSVLACKASLQVIWAIVRHRPRCVHVVNSNAGARILGAVLLTRLLPRPILGPLKWILVNHNAGRVFSVDRVFDAFCIRLFHEVVAVSQACKRLFPPQYHSGIRVIHNGLDLDRFCFEPIKRRIFREHHRLADGSRALGIIGRVSEAKGQMLVLEALERIQESHPEADFALFIVGETLPEDKAYEEMLKAFVDRNDLEKQVHFCGPRDDVHDILSGFDVLLNASSAKVSEAMGLSLAEAMACERVVVAPETGGIPELISHGEDGFLFHPDNSADLAAKLWPIMSELETLGAIRRRAREKIASKFSDKRMVAEYIDLYFGRI